MKVLIVSVVLSVLLCCIISVDEYGPTPYFLKYNREVLGDAVIPKNNPLTEEGVRLGRLLFYEQLLSSNNEMSCGSCHIQSKAFTDGRNLAIGTYGDTLDRNTMSLVNLAWGNEFFWDGRAKSLEQLIRIPLTNDQEMGQDTVVLVKELNNHEHYPHLFDRAFPNQDVSMNLVAKAISQFLRTIVSNGLDIDYYVFPKSESEDIGDNISESMIGREESLRGTFVRFSEMCNPCHGGAIYGNEIKANNMVNEVSTPMKAPSLVNILKTGPYMHDGRFETVPEVLAHYNQHFDTLEHLNPSIEFQSGNFITDYDINNANLFFELLTDEDFIKNPDYSNPFENDFSWDSFY